MATLTIKELDDWIYARLRQRVKQHRRSIVAEATVILDAFFGRMRTASPG